MNKTIKEQAVEYANKYYFNAPGMGVIHLVEAVSTEERKRRLPSKEEFQKEYLNAIGDHREVTNHLYDWLLSYQGEPSEVDEDSFPMGNCNDCGHKICKCKPNDHIGEVNEKVDDLPTINRNELAEKIMLGNMNNSDFYDTMENVVSNSFRLADEFIKQSKG